MFSFQSTLPRGERLCFFLPINNMGTFQSTLPRGERHQQLAALAEGYKVSIHAPTRGATAHELNLEWMKMVSIHAPTRGATPFVMPLPRWRAVSIHAPTRGATADRDRHQYADASFNPRSHAGSDRTTACTASRSFSFNPRSHAGSDKTAGKEFLAEVKFQSTLPRGERHTSSRNYYMTG